MRVEELKTAVIKLPETLNSLPVVRRASEACFPATTVVFEVAEVPDQQGKNRQAVIVHLR